MISVIITAYKTEQHLPRCIDSVLAQSINDFELILVDNASPDRCGQIIDEYACNDERIKVIHLTENKGPGAGRNSALQTAAGEYICFVDSDDTVHTDYLADLLYGLVANEADMSWCGYKLITPNNKTSISHISSTNSTLEGQNKIIAFIGNDSAPLAPWGKLYTEKLLRNFRFMEGVLDDAPVAYQLFFKAKKIAYIAKELYQYYEHSDSTTRCLNDTAIQRQMLMVQGYYEAYQMSNSYYPEIANLVYSTYAKHLCVAYNIAKVYNVQNNAASKQEEEDVWRKIQKIDASKLVDVVFMENTKEKTLVWCLKHRKGLIRMFAYISSVKKGWV